jgi:hypothetical protein
MTQVACPICGTELSMAQLFANEETQRAVARLAAVSMPLGARVLQYCTLFAPPKTRLTVPKQVKLMLQLLPDLERRAISHKGRDWAVPLDVWARGMDQMLAARDAGRLELPMSGHGYLYSILAGLADRQEAGVEAQAEAVRRAPPRQDTVTVRGQTMSIGQGLAQVYGGRDPALAKLDADRGSAVPMPTEVRARLAELRRGPASHHDDSKTNTFPKGLLP